MADKKEKVILVQTISIYPLVRETNLAKISLCDMCTHKVDNYNHRVNTFLNFIPSCANYFVSPDDKLLSQCDDKHFRNKLTIREHLELENLTPECVLGLTPSQYDQYHFLLLKEAASKEVSCI